MLELGIPFSLGTVNWDIIGEYVTPSWFGHLAKFVSAQELDIKDNFHLIKLLRQNDDYIMQRFIEQGYRKKELSILNHMRMSIHAISLSVTKCISSPVKQFTKRGLRMALITTKLL